MPEHASRFSAALYDQFEDERRVADWGGDELFTRMPRPRAVDDAPPPRFRPSLVVVDRSADRQTAPDGDERSGARDRDAGVTAEEAMRARAERLGLTLVVDEAFDAAAAPPPAATRPPLATPDRPTFAPTVAEEWHPMERRWDEENRAANGRRSTVITGRPDGPPRPLPLAPAARRRPARTPAEWIGPRPERIVGWAFALGLLLILIAISTADAATI
jgi:hypothetical protein